MIEYENLKLANAPFLSEINEALKSTINSGWYILGSEVEKFEESFANYIEAKHCIGLASGLDALILGLAVFEFPENSEIIVPSNTYIATILSIVRLGLKPILVEPDIDTYNIDASKIESKITDKTKAIIVVHLYGKCCEMDKIQDLSKKYNLKIIEDCAQSHGSKHKGIKAGNFGEIGAFSFYPTKNLGAMGDAGAITTNDDEIADKLIYYRNYGSKIKYHNKYIGYNSRLDEVQATILNVKIKHLDKIIEHKNDLANLYLNKINNYNIKLPITQKDFIDTYHIFAIRHDKRDELRSFLLSKGIKTEIHYPIPPHHQEGYKEILIGNYPISELIHSTILSLPISFANSKSEIETVIETINQFRK
jgi:dTDP-4-amino-4,6-dideoxygalactose transaminase